MKHFDSIVIGNGMMGSAAGRYLSQWGLKVAIMGPNEPTNHKTHNNNGVFSSHYDQGRLCHKLSRDPIWYPINLQATNNYAMLEAESGIQFHGPVGMLHAIHPTADERRDLLHWIETTRDELNIEMEYFLADEEDDHLSWKRRFPMLDFPEDYDLYFEPNPAGYINPRQLITAQNVIAQQKHGAIVITQRVTGVSSSRHKVTITTEDGSCYTADKALIACGAFTNFNNLLPELIPLRYKTETTIWGTVSAEMAERLKQMPCVVYDIDDPDIDDIYMAPPLIYPDGSYKIKMGCNTAGEVWPTTLDEIQTWFQSGRSDDDLPAMERALRSQLPDVEFIDVTSHRCIVTYTPSGYPTIDAVPSDIHGRLFVATGGNGSGAQGSDTLGHLAAGLMFDGRWPQQVPRDVFRATNSWGNSRKKLTKAQERANTQ